MQKASCTELRSCVKVEVDVLLLQCCFTSTEARWLIRDGDRGGRGRKSEGSTADTARKRPERPWTAARTMEVLRRRWTSWALVLNKPTFSVDVKQQFNQPLALSEPGPTRTPDRTRRQTKSTCKTRPGGPGRPCRVLALPGTDRPQGDRHREHAINSSALTTPRTRPLLNCFTTPCLRSRFSVKADSPPDQALLLFWDGEVEVFDIPRFFH